jgi:restriction system protein
MSFRSIARGWVGEHAVAALLTASLNKEIYTSFHNVIVPTIDGTAQIDHIVASQFGIFVIETKNASGWIFGCERDPKWTQVLFGKKCQFQNPLRQNYGHTRALAEFLLLDHSIFQSIIFFAARCEFKTAVPTNVMTSGLASYIQKFQRPCLEQECRAKVVGEIQPLKRNPNLTTRTHVATLRRRCTRP